MKGKYAARAALRREDSDVRSEIEAYQHNVKRLTAENGKLKADLAAERAQCKQEARRLKALLDEGLSPELAALRQELEHQRERADKAVADKREIQRKWDNASEGMLKLLQEHQADPDRGRRSARINALDALVELVDDPGNPSKPKGSLAGIGTMPEVARKRLGTEAAKRIDQARGFGRYPREAP